MGKGKKDRKRKKASGGRKAGTGAGRGGSRHLTQAQEQQRRDAGNAQRRELMQQSPQRRNVECKSRNGHVCNMIGVLPSYNKCNQYLRQLSP